MAASYVVTGGGHQSAVEWTESVDGVHVVVGSADDLDVARAAARLAEEHGPLTGWVSNAAIFREADLPDDPDAVLDLVRTNLAPTVVGCSVAVSAFVTRAVAVDHGPQGVLQRRCAGLGHHRALRGLPGGRSGPRGRGRGAGRASAPRRSRRTAWRGRGRRCVPALRGGRLRQRCCAPGRGGRAAYGPDPEER